MGSVSFLVLFLHALSVLLSFAAEDRKHPRRCPGFDCGKLGQLHFPYNNETNPDCGLRTVVNCTEATPQIQLERGGRYFGVKSVSQADYIVIQDEQLQKQLKHNKCDSIANLTFSSSPSISFRPVPALTLLTLFKCLSNHNIHPITEYNYASCDDFIIHYNHPNHTSITPSPLPPPPPPPPHCSIIEYPVNMSLGIANLHPLLTSDITLEVLVSPDCIDCFDRKRGQCQDEKGKFKCAHVIGNNKRRKLTLGLGISAGSITIIICFFIIRQQYKRNVKRKFTSIFWEKQIGKYLNVEAFLRNHGSLAPKKYRYSEVKKMTRSFKDKLGEGGYGVVYKGMLLNGDLVAVKVLSETKGNGEEFINEIASISRTSHVNIVTLMGFCFEGPKRALIYEFMPNGSLEKYICNGNPSETNCQLGWETLYKIAIGIGRGLEYLHRGCSARILHFDIKPHNILLSEDFCPKISDFGLAKLCTKKNSIISMLGTRGTPGYIAPEVFSRTFGVVSHKSDVYSYGMMVLDMVGGRKDVDGGSSHTGEIYFPDSIYKFIEEDEDLEPQQIMNEQSECTKKMIIVSLWCIQTRPSDRPPMCEVLNMLEGSLQSLQIPPKPFLFSPPRSQQDSSTTVVS